MAVQRLHYFHLQFLQEEDFTEEQTYHLSMRRRHNQFLHTWGIVDRLEVEKTGDKKVIITPGMAIDRDGKEIIVTSQDLEREVDLSDHTNKELYLLIFHHEEDTDETDQVGLTDKTKTTESFKTELVDSPPEGEFDKKLILAKITVDFDGNVADIDDSEATKAGANMGEGIMPAIKLTVENHDKDEWPEMKGYDVESPGVQGIEVTSANTAFSGSLTVKGELSIEEGISIRSDNDYSYIDLHSSKGLKVTGPVGGIEPLYIDNMGQVFINTGERKTPGEVSLSVNGTIESTRGGIKFPDGSVQDKAAEGATSPWIQADGHIFYSGGNVGIETESPGNFNLKVNGRAGFGPIPADFNWQFHFDADKNQNCVRFDGPPGGLISIHPDVEFVVDKTNVPAGRFVIKSNGNVGIGIALPGEKLTVGGTIESTSGGFKFPDGSIQETAGGGTSLWAKADSNIFYADGNVGIGVKEPLAKLTVGDNIAGSYPGVPGITIGNPSGATAIWMGKDSRNGLHIAWLDPNYGDITVSGGKPLVLQRYGGGNVGIGTTDPGMDKLDVRGRCYSDTGWFTTNADYAEYFESYNGSAIPAATSVTFTKGGKVRPSKEGELPIGIVCTNSAFVGNSYKEWPKKYLRDDFGNLIMETYKEKVMVPKKEKVTRERQKTKKKTVIETVTRPEIVFENGKYLQKKRTEEITSEVEEPLFEEIDLYDEIGQQIIGKHRVPVMETYEEEIDGLDENGQPVLVKTRKSETKTRPKLNPEYDESQEYILREERPEWHCVGLLGQLPLRKGQPVAPTWVKMKDISDDVELWLVK